MWLTGGVGGGDWPPDNIVAKTPWRHRKLEAGGGPAVDGGVHMFHRMRYLFGEIDEIGALAPTLEPRRYTRDASGQIVESLENEVEDAFFANLKFANGAIGTAFAGVVGHGGPAGITGGTAIYGTRGVLTGGELLLDGDQRASAQEIFDQDPSAELARLKEHWFPLGVKDGFGLQHLDFYRAIESGGRAEVDGMDGLRDLACSYAVLESATLNRPVKVADVLAGAVDAYQREIDVHYGLV
jgi:predicted dehydrogenase